jgi:hypothetical protein
MRTSDLSRLSVPYSEVDGSHNPDPMSALGVDIPSWKQLESTILDDLTEKVPYGIHHGAADSIRRGVVKL